MGVIVNSNFDDDYIEELRKFEASNAGVKGVVDSGLLKLPRIFIQPPEKLSPSVGVSLDIPVIDLKGLDDDLRREEIVNEIREVAETWGICHLINHGVQSNVINDMLDGVKNFHEQPPEIKNEFLQIENKKMAELATYRTLCWMDFLSCSFPDQQIAQEKIPQVCRRAMNEYTKHIFQLKDTLSQILSEALGLCPDYLANIECMKSMLLFGNYYPACPEPHLALGSDDHRDPHFLTILAQGNVGGLEFIHDNQWFEVPYVEGSLTINFTDMMQIISNDKFRAVVHRVAAGPETRISVACHFTASSRKMETEYGPLKEIITDDNRPVYRHVTPSEFMAHFYKNGGQNSISKFKLEQH